MALLKIGSANPKKKIVAADAKPLKGRKLAKQQKALELLLSSTYEIIFKANKLSNELSRFIPETPSRKVALQQLNTDLNDICETWRRLNTDSPTVEIGRAVVQLAFGELPAVLGSLADVVEDIRPEKSASPRSVSAGISSIVDLINGLATVINSTQSAQQIFFELEPVEPAYLPPDPIPHVALVFPKIVFPKNINLEYALQRLKTSWEKANASKNTVENEYFLEQVIQAYIPEAWKMFDSLKLSSDEVQKAAEEEILEQFKLLTDHIDGMVAIHETNTVNQMKIQTEFLRTKTADKERQQDSAYDAFAATVGAAARSNIIQSYPPRGKSKPAGKQAPGNLWQANKFLTYGDTNNEYLDKVNLNDVIWDDNA
jgi:hypothetical protein